MSFDALVRFEDGDEVSYGNLLETTNDGYKVVKLNGNLADGFSPAGTVSMVVFEKIRERRIFSKLGRKLKNVNEWLPNRWHLEQRDCHAPCGHIAQPHKAFGPPC